MKMGSATGVSVKFSLPIDLGSIHKPMWLVLCSFNTSLVLFFFSTY
jgi:hypothetical protein